MHANTNGHSADTIKESCLECQSVDDHYMKYIQARMEYEADFNDQNKVCFSADFQEEIITTVITIVE